jgi:AcrR family transcriptional regulator
MEAEAEKKRRKPRADSLKNRARLLEAAAKIFSAGGSQASLEAVARQAGVGIGTLYRHFPTREDLFSAVYRREVDQLGDLSDALSDEADPVEALRQWLRANVQMVATKKGMIEALQLATFKSSELQAYSSKRMTDAISRLLTRAIEAGNIRDDVPPEDVLRALLGIFYSQGPENWQTNALRLVDVFVDGLRKR